MMAKEIKQMAHFITDNGTNGKFGIDSKGKLYWNEKAVVTEHKVSIQLWVSISIVIASASTLVIAIITVLNYI